MEQPRLAAVLRRRRSKYGATVGSRSIAISLPVAAQAAASSVEWPPAPNVPSISVSPGRGASARAPRPRVRGRGQSRLARRSATCSALPSISCRCSRQAARSQISRWSWTPATETSRWMPAVWSSCGREDHPPLLVELGGRRAGEEATLHHRDSRLSPSRRRSGRRLRPSRPGRSRRGSRRSRA